MANFWVNGIVSHRDKKPYIQLSNENGIFAQLSMSEARHIAGDILLMASRTEADAMLHRFIAKMDLGEKSDQTAALLMQEFRDFRAELDAEQVEHGIDKGEEDS